jgi:pimeloyl-ACP methyl ester carboxylesterase
VPLREVNGVRLLVEETGDGEPLILVHGSWVSRHSWAFVVEDLARSFRVIAYDRRGHTDSEDGPGPGTRAEDEDDLAALIESLGDGSAHVAAQSFGGSIALGLAARRPELFRTLAVHEPPLAALAADDPDVGRFGQASVAAMEQIERGEHEEAARYFVENVALGPGGWGLLPAELRAAMAGNAETFAGEVRDPGGLAVEVEALRGVTAPMLLTKGDQSPPFFAKIVARLDEELSGARVHTFAGAGHAPQQTHPADYVGVVSEFVGG